MNQTQEKIEAAVLNRLLTHLRDHPDIQNIDLMILADFCRNCLSNWYQEEAAKNGINLDRNQAREIIYGMPYERWKSLYQTAASEEQMQRYRSRKKRQ